MWELGPANEREAERRRLNRLSGLVVESAHKVGRALGHGFLEKVYENALCWELRKHALDLRQQCAFQVLYDGHFVGDYIPDLLVDEALIVEVKAVDRLETAHRRQCLNYLRAADLRLGLLLNFGRPRLEVARIVNQF